MSSPPASSQPEVYAPPAAAAGVVAQHTPCRNCDAPLSGPYCAQCGQRDLPDDPSAWAMLREMAGEATDIDGRLATTLRALLVPGRLTRDWVAGRRARYFSPLKLYLTVSVLYFFASAMSPVQKSALQTTGDDDAAGVRIGTGGAGTRAASERAGTATAASPASATVSRPVGGQQAGDLPPFLRGGLQRVARDPAAFQRRVTEWAPRIFFVLVPLFAVLTALVYRERRRRMPHHVWLALHVHAFAFLLALGGELTEFTRWAPLQVAAGVVVLVALPAYVVLTLRAVYGGTWIGTIARASLLGALYIGGAVLASAFALVTLLALA